MRRLPALAPLALAAAVLLAATACGGDDTADARTDPGGDNPLANRTFVSTQVSRNGTPRPLAPRTELSIAFQPQGALAGDAGCNHLLGKVVVSADHLTVTDVGGTEMACDQARMDQETWYVKFLTANPRYRLDRDTLTLTAKGTTITFTDRKAAHPDRPLEGTTWHLDGFVDGDTASSLPAGLAATVRIAGKQLTVTACNEGTAPVSHDDRTLDVGPFTFPTPKPCPSGPAEVLSKVTELLQGRVTYRIDGDTLTLSRGGHGLTLVARG